MVKQLSAFLRKNRNRKATIRVFVGRSATKAYWPNKQTPTKLAWHQK